MKITAFGNSSATGPIEKIQIERREVAAEDVAIKIHYCGICHSDIHTARSEWGPAHYPCVPGHEIVGTVTKVGKKVKRFKVGEAVGVGCLVDSCGKCNQCKLENQQFCENSSVWTYNAPEKKKSTYTFGGYSTDIVVTQKFVFKLAKNLPLDRVAPLLCAGITTYSPLKRFKVKKGDRVGVVGLGGLGHMAVKIAKAMGAQVTVLSTSANKEKEALLLGAKKFVVTKDPQALVAIKASLDFIIDTVSASHDVNMYLGLLKVGGSMCMVGVPPDALPIHSMSLIGGRKTLTGSLIGGVKETQEMLNFCIKKKVFSDIELITPDKINEAYERVIKSDVKYRFVVDLREV